MNTYYMHVHVHVRTLDIAPVGKKTQGIMADGEDDDDEDEGVPEEKRLADDVRAESKVRTVLECVYVGVRQPVFVCE